MKELFAQPPSQVLTCREFEARWLDGEYRTKEGPLDVVVVKDAAGTPRLKSGGNSVAHLESQKEVFGFEWAITDGSRRDLEGDWVYPQGCHFEGYFEGRGVAGLAPVLHAHQDKKLPVAGTEQVVLRDQLWIARGRYFTDWELGFEPDQPHISKSLRRLAPTGVLRASIGFIPFGEHVAKAEGNQGLDFLLQWITEWSQLVIAANEGARRLALSVGLTEKDLSQIYQQQVRWLDGEGGGLIVPRGDLERSVENLAPRGKTFFSVGSGPEQFSTNHSEANMSSTPLAGPIVVERTVHPGMNGTVPTVQQPAAQQPVVVEQPAPAQSVQPPPPQPPPPGPPTATVPVQRCVCGNSHTAVKVKQLSAPAAGYEPGELWHGTCPDAACGDPVYVQMKTFSAGQVPAQPPQVAAQPPQTQTVVRAAAPATQVFYQPVPHQQSQPVSVAHAQPVYQSVSHHPVQRTVGQHGVDFSQIDPNADLPPALEAQVVRALDTDPEAATAFYGAIPQAEVP